MLCCIQDVIEKTLIMSERTFTVFNDYSKAFDSVSQIQMDFPRHIVALIQALYEKQSAIVGWKELTHQALPGTEWRTERMYSMFTPMLCLYGARNERGHNHRTRRRYWRKIYIKFTVRRMTQHSVVYLHRK